jgi:hypothetical protein
MNKIVGLLVAIVFSGGVLSAEIDTVVILKSSPFFTGFLKRKEPIAALHASPNQLINPQHPSLRNKGYQIFKTDSNAFIHIASGGLLYQLENPNDSILAFKRIDDTENFNYNISAFLFTNKQEIYNIGGYGFWKSSGTLRKYNFKDAEWDADPINEEIHIPLVNDLCWFNPSTEKLFIPYQQIINYGIAKKNDETEIDKRVYQFDLKEKKWGELGKTHPDFFEIISKSTWCIPTEKGYLLSYNYGAYDINFEENQITEYLSSSFTQTMERIDESCIRYYYQGTIYYLDSKTSKYDSLKIPIGKFKRANFGVWKRDNTGFIIGLVPIILILAAVVAKKKKAKASRKKIPDTTTRAAPVGNTVKIKFSETERQLLNLLLDRSKNNRTTTITEINYVLGIKDKNLGLQKKVRSDVMNSINEKFNFLQDGETELVHNIRSQADKRFFEYYINKDNSALLEIMLKEEA